MCVSIYIYVCVCVCLFIYRVYIYMCVCVCVCMYVCVQMNWPYIYISSYHHIIISSARYLYVYNSYVDMHVRTHTQTHRCMCVCATYKSYKNIPEAVGRTSRVTKKTPLESLEVNMPGSCEHHSSCFLPNLSLSARHCIVISRGNPKFPSFSRGFSSQPPRFCHGFRGRGLSGTPKRWTSCCET